MTQREWKSKDLLLLLLYAPVNGVVAAGVQGRTRLQKLVFVFRKEVYSEFRFSRIIPEDALPQFEPWHFGPFSKQVYTDIDFFRAIGFISAQPSEEPPGPEEAEEYAYWQQAEDVSDEEDVEYLGELLCLSQAGQDFVEARLWPELDDAQKDGLSKFKSKFAEAPLHSILQYVYSKYPEQTEKSTILDKVLGKGGGQ